MTTVLSAYLFMLNNILKYFMNLRPKTCYELCKFMHRNMLIMKNISGSILIHWCFFYCLVKVGSEWLSGLFADWIIECRNFHSLICQRRRLASLFYNGRPKIVQNYARPSDTRASYRHCPIPHIHDDSIFFIAHQHSGSAEICILKTKELRKILVHHSKICI